MPARPPRVLRVLLVDDNQALRENLVECLESEGHQVGQAADGADALGWLAREARPDVVVLDQVMPGLSGRELAAALRRSPLLPRPGIVLMTGDTTDDLSGCADLDAVIEKPFGVAELLAAIARAAAAAAG